MTTFLRQWRDYGDGSFDSGKKFRNMLLRREGTKDLFSNEDNHHDDGIDDSGGGKLSASKLGKAVGSKCRCGGQIHVRNVINIFVPGLVPKEI